MVAPEARERAEGRGRGGGAEAPRSCSTAGSAAAAPGRHARPDLVEVADHESELAREEVFGPVLALVRAPDLDAALEFANGSRYGNAGAIFTSSGEAARAYRYGVEAGMLGVNIGVPPRSPGSRSRAGRTPSTPTCTRTAPTRSTSTPGRR